MHLFLPCLQLLNCLSVDGTGAQIKVMQQPLKRDTTRLQYYHYFHRGACFKPVRRDALMHHATKQQDTAARKEGTSAKFTLLPASVFFGPLHGRTSRRKMLHANLQAEVTAVEDV